VGLSSLKSLNLTNIYPNNKNKNKKNKNNKVKSKPLELRSRVKIVLFRYDIDQLKEDYKHGLRCGLTFCLKALPMILGNDPEKTVDFASVDFTDNKAKKSFTDTAQLMFESILTEDKRVRSRLRGILDDVIAADIM
jgi:hypothetical protein